jgi:DNA-binding transcriptional ArsR family regulator
MAGIASVVLAHIGKIPVEEWLPFVVPFVALFIYVRRKERRRRAAMAKLPETSSWLDEAAVARVRQAWQDGDYRGVGEEHLPLLYPPGPDGLSVAEIAARTDTDAGRVERLLDALEEHEYVHLEVDDGGSPMRAMLTVKGYGLVGATEDALLEASMHTRAPG